MQIVVQAYLQAKTRQRAREKSYRAAAATAKPAPLRSVAESIDERRSLSICATNVHHLFRKPARQLLSLETATVPAEEIFSKQPFGAIERCVLRAEASRGAIFIEKIREQSVAAIL